MTADPTLVGAYIGSYRVVKRLGEGGMGRVYLAVSPSGRAVAVKVLPAHSLADPGLRRRFRTEIDAARAVSGAFTAAVVDADPDATPPWLATAYIAGPSLYQAVTELGPMAGADLVRLAAGVAEAVAAIHRANIVHRDLTPMNVLLADDGPHVIDFGISRMVDDRGQVPPSSRILGVPGYMAPERIRGRPCTPAGDVFSLGAVLAFAAQGRSPFGDGPDALVQENTLWEPPLLDGVPAGLREPIEACLHKDPNRRPQSPALPELFRGGNAVTWAPSLARRVRQAERTLTGSLPTTRFTRRRVLFGAGTLAVAATGGILLAEWGSNGSPAAARTASPVSLAWTAALARADMTIAAVGDKTVICTDRLGAASFDLASGRQLWSDSVPQGASDNSDGTRLYSVRTDGHLHALDARTGRQLWVSDVADGPIFQGATPTTVIVSEGALLRGLDAATGRTRWTYPTTNALSGVSGEVANGQFIVRVFGGVNGQFVAGAFEAFTALDINSGKVLWEKDLTELTAPATGSVYYALDDNLNLLSLNATTGGQVWSKQTTLPSQATTSLTYLGSLRLIQGTLYCYPATAANVAGVGVLAAFDPNHGSTLWTEYPSNDNGGSAATGDTFGYLDGTIRALDAKTGKALWSTGAELGTLQFAGTIGGLFLAAALDNGSRAGLYGWDARTGRQLWHYPVTDGSGNWSFQQSSNGLFAARSGRLYAFRPQ